MAVPRGDAFVPPVEEGDPFGLDLEDDGAPGLTSQPFLQKYRAFDVGWALPIDLGTESMLVRIFVFL